MMIVGMLVEAHMKLVDALVALRMVLARLLGMGLRFVDAHLGRAPGVGLARVLAAWLVMDCAAAVRQPTLIELVLQPRLEVV